MKKFPVNHHFFWILFTITFAPTRKWLYVAIQLSCTHGLLCSFPQAILLSVLLTPGRMPDPQQALWLSATLNPYWSISFLGMSRSRSFFELSQSMLSMYRVTPDWWILSVSPLRKTRVFSTVSLKNLPSSPQTPPMTRAHCQDVTRWGPRRSSKRKWGP